MFIQYKFKNSYRVKTEISVWPSDCLQLFFPDLNIPSKVNRSFAESYLILKILTFHFCNLQGKL